MKTRATVLLALAVVAAGAAGAAGAAEKKVKRKDGKVIYEAQVQLKNGKKAQVQVDAAGKRVKG